MLTRRSARLVILSPEMRILLFHVNVDGVHDPLCGGALPYWNTPGGGVEPEETFERAAARELREETGVPVGPWIWTSDRIISFADGRRMRFHERFFLVRAPSDAVDISNLFGEELDWITAYRWWSPAELAASDDAFAPLAMPALVADLAAGRIPETPVRVDCLTSS